VAGQITLTGIDRMAEGGGRTRQGSLCRATPSESRKRRPMVAGVRYLEQLAGPKFADYPIPRRRLLAPFRQD